jgi:hypothetical protein
MKKKTSALVKLILFVILLGLIFFIWNSSKNIELNKLNEAQAIQEMNKLKEKYGVTEAYSTNEAKMNDYLSELSVLAAKTDEGGTKVIQSELYSGLTFYYLTKTLAGFQLIECQTEKGNSIQIMETKKQLKLAEDNSILAEETFNRLSEQQKQTQRENQLQTIQTHKETIQQMKEYFEEKC